VGGRLDCFGDLLKSSRDPRVECDGVKKATVLQSGRTNLLHQNLISLH
jgi:hypothetical protein